MYQRKKRYKSETKTFHPYMLDTLQTNITNIEMYQRKKCYKSETKIFHLYMLDTLQTIFCCKYERQYSVLNTG